MNLTYQFLFLFSIFFLAKGQKLENVKAVATVFRHGDRHPSNTYPGDPYEMYFNITGYGNLTHRGCRRLFRNGRYLSKLIPGIERADITKVVTSPTPRCVDSAKCYMRGLKLSTVMDHSIEILNATINPMLDHSQADCPLLDNLKVNDTSVHQVYYQYPVLINNASKITNLTLPVNLTYKIQDDLLDPIITEDEMNLSLPSWFTPEFRDDANSFITHVSGVVNQFTIENKLSGLFLKDLINNFRNSPQDQLSFYGYSTHDSTLGPIMVTVNTWEGERPNYGESIIFTLTNDDQVNVHYLDIDHNLRRHIPLGCDENNCSLDSFASGVSGFISDDLKKDCKKN